MSDKEKFRQIQEDEFASLSFLFFSFLFFSFLFFLFFSFLTLLLRSPSHL